jgi:alanine dehydrogenase
VVLILRHEDVRASVTMADAIEAMEIGFREEAEGGIQQPQRTNIPIENPKGFLRLGPCIMKNSRWMGFKAMNLAEDTGCRYQVHLYSMDDGALRAIMDAQLLTTLRTGATSAVATKRLARKGPGVVGVVGSGREAFMQVEAMRVLGCIGTAKVYSPTPASRESFAAYFRNTGHGHHRGRQRDGSGRRRRYRPRRGGFVRAGRHGPMASTRSTSQFGWYSTTDAAGS